MSSAPEGSFGVDARCPGRGLGIDARAARRAAQQQLAAAVPAVVLAEMLGVAIRTSVVWVHAAGGDWVNYAALVTDRADARGP